MSSVVKAATTIYSMLAEQAAVVAVDGGET